MQRLIKKASIIIPYAEKLSFPIGSPSLRRDNQKLLTLIEAVTLLYQYQRKTFTKDGRLYVVSTISDYKAAYSVFKHAFRHTSMLNHSVAGELLNIVSRLDKKTFTRKDVARFSGWPDYKVRDNIRYLEEAGLVSIIQKPKGKEALYCLKSRLCLTDPERLEEYATSTS